MATANKNLSAYDNSAFPKANEYAFGIVVSEWNDEITEGLYRGAYECLVDCGVKTENIARFNVPGSFELINGAYRLHQLNHFDAIIVIGCVIEGETRHFDFVCDGVTQGIAALNHTFKVPTIFCVLTDRNKEQSLARSGGLLGNKGVEAAVTALKMVEFKPVNNQPKPLV